MKYDIFAKLHGGKLSGNGRILTEIAVVHGLFLKCSNPYLL